MTYFHPKDVHSSRVNRISRRRVNKYSAKQIFLHIICGFTYNFNWVYVQIVCIQFVSLFFGKWGKKVLYVFAQNFVESFCGRLWRPEFHMSCRQDLRHSHPIIVRTVVYYCRQLMYTKIWIKPKGVERNLYVALFFALWRVGGTLLAPWKQAENFGDFLVYWLLFKITWGIPTKSALLRRITQFYMYSLFPFYCCL